MAGDGRGGRDDPDAVRRDKEEPDSGEGGRGAHAEGDQGAQAPASVEGEGYNTERVRLQITARRVRIDPGKKRASYIRRLERVMKECDKIVADPESHEELQVKALAVLIRAVQVCYDLVTDVEVEMLEAEVEEIKRLVEEGAREGEEEPDR
jgi:hypothetical protein